MTMWERAGAAGKSLRNPLRATLRRATEARIRFQAGLEDATVYVDIHPYVVFEAVPQIEVYPGSHTVVRIGASTRIGRRVQLCLRGGVLTVGENCEIRHSSTLHVGGVLDLADSVGIGVGVGLHSAERVEIGSYTIVGDHGMIIDSAHLRTPPSMPIHHSYTAAPVRIGRNVWIATNSTVPSGITIGDQSIVAANSVVTKDVPPWTMVGGVPARVIKEVEVDPSFRAEAGERALDDVTES